MRGAYACQCGYGANRDVEATDKQHEHLADCHNGERGNLTADVQEIVGGQEER